MNNSLKSSGLLSFYLLYYLKMLSGVTKVHSFGFVWILGQHSRHITQHALKKEEKIFILVTLIDNILTVFHYTMPSSMTQSHVCFHSAGQSHREFYTANVVDIRVWICVWFAIQTVHSPTQTLHWLLLKKTVCTTLFKNVLLYSNCIHISITNCLYGETKNFFFVCVFRKFAFVIIIIIFVHGIIDGLYDDMARSLSSGCCQTIYGHKNLTGLLQIMAKNWHTTVEDVKKLLNTNLLGGGKNTNVSKTFARCL